MKSLQDQSRIPIKQDLNAVMYMQKQDKQSALPGGLVGNGGGS